MMSHSVTLQTPQDSRFSTSNIQLLFYWTLDSWTMDTKTDFEQFKECIDSLECRLAERSENLEEAHLEAAIDAQLTDCSSNAQPAIASERTPQHEAIFDDYANPNSVNNCFSPYVPTTSEKIAAFLSFAGLTRDDLLLDIGCGDGRVCITAAKLSRCRSVGIDVSPLCIAMAKEVAQEEGLDQSQCSFYEADATIDPDLLLAGKKFRLFSVRLFNLE